MIELNYNEFFNSLVTVFPSWKISIILWFSLLTSTNLVKAMNANDKKLPYKRYTKKALLYIIIILTVVSTTSAS